MNVTPAGRREVILISAYPEEDFADLIDASPALAFVPKSELSRSAILELVTKGAPERQPGAD